MAQIHATAVSIDGHAVLIRGTPGSGKSDLALRLINDGATLVADDRCNLDIRVDQIIVSAPEIIFGLLEVRGLGIIKNEAQQCAPVALIVDLASSKDIERLPEEPPCQDYGPDIAAIRLAAFEASTPIKVRLALAVALNKLEKQP